MILVLRTIPNITRLSTRSLFPLSRFEHSHICRVATFRILYDPAKRLEYNAKSNKSGKSPTGVIPSPPPTGLQKSVSDEDKSSCTSSSVQHKSNTRRQLFSKHNEKNKSTTHAVSNKNQTGSGRSSKRTSKRGGKRRSKSKPKKEYSPTLPSTKDEPFIDENVEHQDQSPHNNISNVALRQTYEQITKHIEHTSQQQIFPNIESTTETEQKVKASRDNTSRREINKSTETKHKGKTSREDSSRQTGVRHDREKAPVENGSTFERSRSQVTWKDSGMDLSDDVGSMKEDFSMTTDIQGGGCLDLQLIEQPTDAVDANSLVGFLRSSGFENQAYLLQELRNEVRGSISDTIMAVDQVLNAFKIGDDDIDAVVGNIRQERNCLAKHIAHDS